MCVYIYILYMCTWNIFITLKNKEIFLFATPRMNLEDLMLSEISPTEKDTV